MSGLTVADLVALLRADPSLAIQVVAALRVAGPWMRCGWRGEDARRAGWDGPAAEAYPDGSWSTPDATSSDNDLGESQQRTLDEAMIAADAALVDAGWVLA